MTANITIRPAMSDEYRLLSDLAFRSKAYWGYSEEFMDGCRAELSTTIEEIQNPDRDYFIADSHGEVLGYYAVEKLSHCKYELEHLFVEPKHIGHGIGIALIEHAKSFVKNKGAKSLLIQGDHHAEKFYIAAGGVQIGDRESDSIPGRYLPEFMIYL